MAPASRMTHADKCYYMQMILILFMALTASLSFNDKEPSIQTASSQESMTDIKGWESAGKDVQVL